MLIGPALGVSTTNFSVSVSDFFVDFFAGLRIDTVLPVERIEALESHIMIDWFIFINKGFDYIGYLNRLSL
jgi:hypothetical protein